jgi:hypothetical protein
LATAGTEAEKKLEVSPKVDAEKPEIGPVKTLTGIP